MPNRQGIDIPHTVLRSPPKAQRTYAKAKKSAERTYGSGERAGRTAISALKHKFEKVGDRWEPKNGKGPSDPQAKRSVAGKSDGARNRRGKTYGGIDVEGSTRDELYARARRLGVSGASRMKKAELAQAIARKQ
ncbi:MAG: ChaB family protein [Pseudomonadota bacterium]